MSEAQQLALGPGRQPGQQACQWLACQEAAEQRVTVRAGDVVVDQANYCTAHAEEFAQPWRLWSRAGSRR